MLNLAGNIIVLTGIMAAGKSTVGELLAQRLVRSVHLRGDIFRKMIVSGRAEMAANPGEEAIRQLKLRYELSLAAALRYAEEGFAVVYQDIVIGSYLSELAEQLRATDYIFVLCPSVDAVAERETSRTKKGYRGFAPDQLDHVLRHQTERIGCWLDSTNQSPDETVELVLGRLKEARVG